MNYVGCYTFQKIYLNQCKTVRFSQSVCSTEGQKDDFDGYYLENRKS